MALHGLSYTPTQRRATLKSLHTLCTATSNSVSHSSIQLSSVLAKQSSHKKPSPNPCGSLKVSTRAGLNSCFSASNTQLEVLKKSRVIRGHALKNVMAQGSTVMALQGGERAPRRLVDVIRAIPKISKAYFKSPFRRALYGAIALLGGFYVAQTISLSFGTIGVNDVIAAALCVFFAEYVTKFYHSRMQMTFSVALLNNFKMGFTYGLFIDAFKLAS